MKNWFILILFNFIYISAYAEQTWYVTIKNNTPWEMKIKKDKSKCWYDKDFGSTTYIASGDEIKYKTEDKNSGSCWFGDSDHYLYFNITGNVITAKIELEAKLKISGKHCRADVKNASGQNIDIDKSCGSYNNTGGSKDTNVSITINPPGTVLDFKVKTLGGLGDTYLLACGTPLYTDGDGKVYVYCPNSTAETTVNTLRVRFKNALAGCNVLLTQNGNIHSTTCDKTSIGYMYMDTGDVVFACQQASNDDSACPWLLESSNGKMSAGSINVYS